MNPEAADALAAAMARVEHVTILIPHSTITDMPGIWGLRKVFVDKLRRADSRKAHIFVRFPYGPTVPHSYVHAKTWIFDDEYAFIGSANCNVRSWTHDSEVGVGVYDDFLDDKPTLTFAHRLRIRLWAEHLNMNDPLGHALLVDPVASSVRWFGPGTQVQPYDENGGKDGFVSSRAPQDDVDPSGL